MDLHVLTDVFQLLQTYVLGFINFRRDISWLGVRYYHLTWEKKKSFTSPQLQPHLLLDPPYNPCGYLILTFKLQEHEQSWESTASPLSL